MKETENIVNHFDINNELFIFYIIKIHNRDHTLNTWEQFEWPKFKIYTKQFISVNAMYFSRPLYTKLTFSSYINHTSHVLMLKISHENSMITIY